jgi:hypothetical protein
MRVWLGVIIFAVLVGCSKCSDVNQSSKINQAFPDVPIDSAGGRSKKIATTVGDFFENGELSLSIKAAYEAIPHHQTTFMASRAKMDQTTADFYQELFGIVDHLVTLRVALLLKFGEGNYDEKLLKSYDKILAKLETLEAGQQEEILNHILLAVRGHKSFYVYWLNAHKAGLPKAKTMTRTLASHPEVQSSSRHLQEAYGLLMSTFPEEDSHNSQAFFDHLCALDFI